MVTLQISLQDNTVNTLRHLADERGMSVERFLSERLNRIVAETSSGTIDAEFRKIVQGSIETNRELLKKLAE